MVDQRQAVTLRQPAQRIVGGLGDDRDARGQIVACRLEARQQRQRLRQGLGRAAGFGDDHRGSARRVEAADGALESVGVDILEKPQARLAPGIGRRTKAAIGQRRQGAAAEAGAASAEEYDVVTFQAAVDGLLKDREIVALGGQLQQRQGAILTLLAQALERRPCGGQGRLVIRGRERLAAVETSFDVVREGGFASRVVHRANDPVL